MSALFTRIFWQDASQYVVVGAAGGASAILAPHAHDMFTDVPWLQVASGGVIGAILALLAALGSLRAQPCNGTASYFSGVVARAESARES